ncbi:MAG: 2-amino-4-hydroxy-6-hydroxymethyldihydropteridine diphosphokinase, partial [Bacteroidetes bacterium]
AHYLQTATAQIQARVGKVLMHSPTLETAPWGVSTPHAHYLNQILQVETELLPAPLLDITQDIEQQLGRAGKGENLPRTIDIDILYYDDLIVVLPNLQIPHPRAHERKFILDNMLAIAPQLQHPTLHKTQQALATSIT